MTLTAILPVFGGSNGRLAACAKQAGESHILRPLLVIADEGAQILGRDVIALVLVAGGFDL